MGKNFFLFIIFSFLILFTFTSCQNPKVMEIESEPDNAVFTVKGDINLQKNILKVSSISLEPGYASSSPLAYYVMVKKYELLKSASDNNPVIVYEAEDDGYALVELSSIKPTKLGIGRIQEGTYTHCRTTIIAISQTIDVYDEDNNIIPFQKTYAQAFQNFDNSTAGLTILPVNLINKGDVLVSEDTIFNWFQIDQSKKYSYSLDKDLITPYSVVIPEGEEVKTLEFTSPITIEVDKRYSGTLTFNIADTFIWDDLDGDKKFEPTSDDHDSTMNGFNFNIAMPEITVQAEEE